MIREKPTWMKLVIVCHICISIAPLLGFFHSTTHITNGEKMKKNMGSIGRTV